MSTPNTSLVKWVYKLILQKPPTKYEEGMVLYPIPVIPLADLTELVEGLRRQYRGEAGFVYRQAFDELLTQLEAHRN